MKLWGRVMVENGSERGVYSSVFLTILGVTQAAVFALLTISTVNYLSELPFDGGWPAVQDEIAFTEVFRFLVGSAVILVVTCEYVYFVQMTHREVGFWDVGPMFMLSFAEVVIFKGIGDPHLFWIGWLILSIAGFNAFWKSERHDWTKNYPRPLKFADTLKRYLRIRMFACTLSGIGAIAILWQLFRVDFPLDAHYFIAGVMTVGFTWAFFRSSYQIRQEHKLLQSDGG